MIGTLCIAALVLAQTDTSELDQAFALLDQLDAVSLSADYRQQPLQDVLKDLNEHLPAPVRADWDALARLGVKPNLPITIRINQNRASTVLAGLTLTIGDEFEHPTFEVHAGQIVLTTIAGTAPMRVLGVYDVRDLLANADLIQRLADEVPPAASAPAQAPEKKADEKPPESAQPDKPQQAPPAEPDEPPAPLIPGQPPHAAWPRLELPKIDVTARPENDRPLSPGERLFMLITDHVDPEAWMNFGGDRARISEVNGLLVVTAAPTTHRRFRSALQALRMANPASLTIDAAIIDLPRQVYDRIVRENAANAAGTAGALRNAEGGHVLWRALAGVAMNAKLETQSTAEQTDIHVVLAPTFDSKSGTLDIAVEASAKNGSDARSVKTLVALTSDQAGAVIELPAAKSSETMRLLVLLPQRR